MSGKPLRAQPPTPTPSGTPTRTAARSRPMAAGKALMVMVIAFTLAGLLTGADLRARANDMDPGFWRSAALLGVRPLAATSALLGLDRPLRLVDEWRGSGSDALAATGATGPGAAALDASALTTTTTTAQGADGATRVASRGHPLKVWVGGDSLVSRVGEALTNRGDQSGLLAVRTVSKVSSGLCRPDYFNWPGVIADVTATQHPDVSVVLFGGNDYQDLVVDGKEVAPFTPAWTKEYERRVTKVVQTLTADGGRVYWLGLPVMRDPQKNVHAAALDKLYRRVVEGLPRAIYVDTWQQLSDPQGHYTAYRPNAAGTIEKVREPDGEHLTYLGGDRIAAVIIADLRERGALPSN
jgi:lysophospholipase L1-like esterase